jgi:dimethylargininase
MMFTKAIVRKPGSDFAQGLTTSALGAPDVALALEQHSRYIDALRSLGVDVEVLPPLEGMPDACFVEDTAVVADEIAVITHPGAPARQGEAATIATAMSRYKNISIMNAPADIDGGDVLLADNTFFVGVGNRTNIEGFNTFKNILESYQKYKFVAVELADGLHLKSSVTEIAPNTLLLTKLLADHPAFMGYKKVVTPEDEEYAANALLINGTVLTPVGFPKTHKLMQEAGCRLLKLDMSEYRKMDGALTCLSLRF